jgi:hypothetical protein
MALFRCAEYPYLLVLDPRDPGRELARFRDGYFQTDDPFVIAELAKRAHIVRVDVPDGRGFSTLQLPPRVSPLRQAYVQVRAW